MWRIQKEEKLDGMIPMLKSFSIYSKKSLDKDNNLKQYENFRILKYFLNSSYKPRAQKLHFQL